MSDVVLEARGVRKTFPGVERPIEVLDSVDLQVHEGEVVGVVGASGVGKSTLLHVLGSLDLPDAGSVAVAGRDIRGLRGRELDRVRNEILGFVFQFHFLLPEFSALENVMMPLFIRGWSAGRASERAAAWLERVGLADRLGHRPGELSGGEQQRVAVARALVNDPAVILADEPTGNLDFETGEEIHELIRSLADRERQTFVVVTHKRSFGEHADRVLLLAEGRLTPLES